MGCGLSLGIAGANVVAEATGGLYAINVVDLPSLAGIGTVTAGETHAGILARMSHPGAAVTTGPGQVTLTAFLTGGPDPVQAGDTIDILVRFEAPGAPMAVRTAGSLTVAAALPDTANEATQGTVTFPFAGAPRVVGNSLDGAAYIVVPSGTLTLTEPTPAAAGGRHGVMVNPFHQRPGDPAGYNMAFDDRVGGYTVANLATFPRTVSAGDIIVKAISRPTVSNGRDGVFEEYAVCHIVSAAPAANAISPAPFGWPGRGMPAWTTVDMSLVEALRPLLPTGSQRVKADTPTLITNQLDRFNPGLVASASASGGGYEYHSLYAYGAVNGSTWNYGAQIAQSYRAAILQWMSDSTDATNARFALHMAMIGTWLDQIYTGRVIGEYGDGGHFEWTTLARLFALLAQDRADEMASLNNGPTNQMAQGFLMTAPLLARCAPHDSSSDPFSYRLREVSAVSGSTITVNGNKSGDPTWFNFNDMACRKENGTVIGSVSSGDLSRSSTMTFTLSSAAGLTTSDRVYFTPPHALAVGDPCWTLENVTRFNTFSAAYKPTYLAANAWAVESLLVLACGLNGDGTFDAMIGNTRLRAEDANRPAPFGAYIPSVINWATDAWNDWGTALLPSEEITAVSTPGAAREVWPTGFAFASNDATIPVTVTGTPGAAVQIRMVDVEFAGAGTQAWQALGTIGAGGTTTLDWHCIETRFWGRLEVRVGTDNGTILRQEKDLSAGVVLVWVGQSELENALINDYYGSAASNPETVVGGGNVAIHYHDGGVPVVQVITQANRVRSAHVAIANAIAHYMPDAKAKVIIVANAGDGLDEMLDDSQSDWTWARGDDVFRAGTIGGLQTPGVLLLHNLPSLSGYNSNFGTAVSEMITGRRANGAVIVSPAPQTHGGKTLNHTLRDWFGDFSRTRIVNCATRASDYYGNYQSQLRPSWEAAATAIPHFGAALAPTNYIEMAAIKWGRANGANNWTDEAHPGDGAYGTRRWYAALVEVTLAAYGYVSRPGFVLNQATFDAGLNYVELGVTGQTITTSWRINGATPPAGLRKVVGFTFNGASADAEIVAGKIRVLKPGGGTVVFTDTVGLDTGSRMAARRAGSPPNATDLADLQGDWFRGTPVVATAGSVLTQGVPLNLPATSAGLFTNTITGGTIRRVNQSTNNGSVIIGGGVSKTQSHFFFAAELTCPTAVTRNAGARIFDMGSAGQMQYTPTGILVLLVPAVGTMQITWPISLNTRKHIAFHYDGVAGTATMWENGVVVTPSIITNAAFVTSTLPAANGLRLFDNGSLNRSLEATEVSQVVVANAAVSLASVYSGGTVYNLSGLAGTARILLGQDMTANERSGNTAQGWNDGHNLGTAGALTVAGSFTDV